MKILITVLVIVPWSLIFGTAYLAYRRVRGQRAEAEKFMKAIEITEPPTEERKAWMADVVEQSKAAEQRGTNSMGPVERKGKSTWSKADAPVQECEGHLQDLKDIAEGKAVVAGTPPNTYLMRTDIPTYETYQEMKDGWKVVDADHITKIGRA
jgi:hypothetical protein